MALQIYFASFYPNRTYQSHGMDGSAPEHILREDLPRLNDATAIATADERKAD